MIEKARIFAEKAHEGQKRKLTGEPFFNHVCRVATLVEKFTRNPDIISAAYLHDTVEDCNIQTTSLEVDFNLVVASIVDELTNVYTKEAYPDLGRKERKKQEHKRIAKISYSAKLIKLCDRIDNLWDFKKNEPEYGKDFYYIKESRELLEALKGTNKHLETILEMELV